MVAPLFVGFRVRSSLCNALSNVPWRLPNLFNASTQSNNSINLTSCDAIVKWRFISRTAKSYLKCFLSVGLWVMSPFIQHS